MESRLHQRSRLAKLARKRRGHPAAFIGHERFRSDGSCGTVVAGSPRMEAGVFRRVQPAVSVLVGLGLCQCGETSPPGNEGPSSMASGAGGTADTGGSDPTSTSRGWSRSRTSRIQTKTTSLLPTTTGATTLSSRR